MSKVPYYVVDTLFTACCVKPTDQVQKLEITNQGILLTLAYTVETEEGWRVFTVTQEDGTEAVLTYKRLVEIEIPERPEPEAHVHEDGEVHTHEEELVAADG